MDAKFIFLIFRWKRWEFSSEKEIFQQKIFVLETFVRQNNFFLQRNDSLIILFLSKIKIWLEPLWDFFFREK